MDQTAQCESTVIETKRLDTDTVIIQNLYMKPFILGLYF